MKNRVIKILILLGFWLIAVGLMWSLNRNYLIGPEFVDEQDNMVVGRLINEGHKLYSYVFTHHQPGMYLMSSSLQTLLDTNNILMLIKTHRLFVFLWACGWWLLISYKWGKKMLGAMIIIESIKIVYLGEMFLAESVVAYPLLWLVLAVSQKKIRDLEVILNSMLLGGLSLTLAPTWPMLIVISLRMLMLIKKNKVRIISILVTLATWVLVTPWVDWKGYWEGAIKINKEFYVSAASMDSNVLMTVFRMIISPILYLVSNNLSPESIMIRLIILSGLVLVVKKIRHQKTWWLVLIITLANVRSFEMEKLFYDGFHLWPWIVMVVGVTINYLNKKIIMVAVVTWTCLNVTNGYWRQIPKESDQFEIFYSRVFNVSQAIKEVKDDNDKLLVMPDRVLAYWQSGVAPEGRFIFFYKWMTNVDKLREEQINNFEKEPEYLIIGSDENLVIDKYLANYNRLTYRGEKSELYISKEKWKELDETQLNRLGYYGFRL